MQKMDDNLMQVFERIWKAQGREGTFEEFIAKRAAMSEEERVRQIVDKLNAEPGESDSITEFNCKKCLNRGYIWVPTQYLGHWQESMESCTCKKVRASIRRMKRSGLEGSLKKLKDFEVTEKWQQNMVDTATAYLNADHSNGETLFLGGAVGSGKTFIGSAVCRELLRNGHEVIYMPWVNEAQRLKALANDESLSQEIATYSKAEYLYIDDLFKPLPGQTAPTAADIRLAYDIINYRYVNKLPMIISCEKYIMELLEIDEATISRLYERAKGFNVNVGRAPGRNYRMKGADVLV